MLLYKIATWINLQRRVSHLHFEIILKESFKKILKSNFLLDSLHITLNRCNFVNNSKIIMIQIMCHLCLNVHFYNLLEVMRNNNKFVIYWEYLFMFLAIQPMKILFVHQYFKTAFYLDFQFISIAPRKIVAPNPYAPFLVSVLSFILASVLCFILANK